MNVECDLNIVAGRKPKRSGRQCYFIRQRRVDLVNAIYAPSRNHPDAPTRVLCHAMTRPIPTDIHTICQPAQNLLNNPSAERPMH
jgi:hypothetical protein